MILLLLYYNLLPFLSEVNGKIPVTCNENKPELLVLPEVFPFRNILNNTNCHVPLNAPKCS